MQSEEDLRVAVYWIECCLVLHNMIIVFEGNRQVQGEQVGSLRWAREEVAVYGDDPDPTIGLEQPRGTEGQCHDRFSLTILLGGPGLQGTNEVSPDTSRC